MKKNVFLTFAFLVTISTFNEITAQVGIGTDNPTNTLHIKPVDPNDDPLRVEDLNRIMQGDSALLVVNPATGVLRYVHIDSLFQYMTVHIDMDNTNEWQNAVEVPLEPTIDMTNNGNPAENVQEALEDIHSKMPKGIFKSIGDARQAGLIDGDSFYTDPKGVFGCSGCIITLFPGMK